ncbi:alpha/beta hydrolase family protein [Azospirillum sp. B4]|uniref:alpha/beta hydrolase n=1 Tax=Azospirillum sp. B4 TaxID=95605 RepID=UPI00034509BB|nr:alpha/beta hydrolase-fold protein [Azospirillum sp. B4]
MINRRNFAVAMAAMAGTPLSARADGKGPGTVNPGTVNRITVRSAHVPGDVSVSIYTPRAYGQGRPLPLMLLLHGGNGSDQDLLRFIPAIAAAMTDGRIPPLVIAMPSARRSLYMDFKDGSQRWETFILSDLLAHLRGTLAVSTERRHTFIGGVSMGGAGSLRLAFKHPGIFGAVAVLEPAVEPALSWSEVGPRVKFWRPEKVLEPMFGSPVDLEYWAANNPATIAKHDPKRLIDLPIYLDVGDQDMLYINQGTEFLHRILFDAGVGHEYRLVHGAEHVGPSLIPRLVDALDFIGRQIQPPEWIDERVLKARAVYDDMKRAAGMPVEDVDPRRIRGS